MKTRRLWLSVLGIVVAGQIAVPASMILRRERTLREGHAYKFRTAPVDPYDAFRGRYVALRFEETSAPTSGSEAILEGPAYAWIEVGADGFARFGGVASKPPSGKDYICIRGAYTQSNRYQFSLPFDRFYMEEKAAPAAEQAYREHSRQGGARDAYVIVRVRDGQGVIENLYVAGQPIAEFVREH